MRFVSRGRGRIAKLDIEEHDLDLGAFNRLSRTELGRKLHITSKETALKEERIVGRETRG